MKNDTLETMLKADKLLGMVSCFREDNIVKLEKAKAYLLYAILLEMDDLKKTLQKALKIISDKMED